MKSLNEIAKEMGITGAAIYKKFTSYGLSVEHLKCIKRGKSKFYDDDVENLIRLLFNEFRTTENENQVENLKKDNDVLLEKLNTAAKEKNVLEERIKEADKKIELLIMQIDKLTDTIKAAEMIQAVQAQQIKLQEGTKRSFFGTLFSKKKTKTKGDAEL